MSSVPRKNIGLLISQLDHSYQSIMWHTAVGEIRKRGHNCILFLGKTLEVFYGEDTQHNCIYSLVDARNIDGLLIISGTLNSFTTSREFQDFLSNFDRIPSVCTEKIEGMHSSVINNYDGMTEAVRHLVEDHQCKNIFYIGGPENQWDSAERLRGYKEELERQGLPFHEEWVFPGHLNAATGREAADAVWDLGIDKFDALLAANDDMILAAMTRLKGKGVRFPEDLKAIGVDNTHEARSADPPLSSVSISYEEQISYALDMLDALMEGRKCGPIHYVQPQLKKRQSCGCGELSDFNEDEIQDPHSLIRYYKDLSMNYFRKQMQGELRQLELLRISQYIGTMQDTHALAGAIYYNFPLLGIPRMRMLLWIGEIHRVGRCQWSLTDRVEMAAEISDKGNLYSHEPVVIDRVDWVPHWIQEGDESVVIMVLPLLFQKNQYGFLIVTEGMDLDILYETLRGQVSSALQGIQLIKEHADIAEELGNTVKKLEESRDQIEAISIKDELTGIYNRRGFMNLSQKELEISKRYQRDYLLIFIDMDGLKKINDTLGHDAGDRAIIETASQLKKVFRTSDIIARLGGDEFIILVLNSKVDKYILLRERLEESVKQFNDSKKEAFILSMSLGYAFYNGVGEKTLDQLMVEADIMLYQEKQQKKEIV